MDTFFQNMKHFFSIKTQKCVWASESDCHLRHSETETQSVLSLNQMVNDFSVKSTQPDVFFNILKIYRKASPEKFILCIATDLNSAVMSNMCSATGDSSEYQICYLEERNTIKCFLKSLSTINREIKHLLIFIWLFKSLFFSCCCFLYKKFCFWIFHSRNEYLTSYLSSMGMGSIRPSANFFLKKKL